MSQVEFVNITIDGTTVQVPAGEMVIESARRVGIEIPHFCYHPRLTMEAGANCRMCLVEVSMPRKNPDGTLALARMPKPQTSCSLPAAEGMVIETETPMIVEARKGMLEFLLINHPLDCPICDRGGECPLQNNTMHYGAATTRFVEEKRHPPKAYPLSKYVIFDRERCIHCARCTRFASDISGDAQLDFLKRGADMEVSSFRDTEFTSLYSGNVIEVCPVGALLSRPYRFTARPWDLSTQKSICTECSNGCNIKLDHRAGKLLRVNARLNEEVNEEWTCDQGKFGMDYVSHEKRLRRPLIRDGAVFREVSWDEALTHVATALSEAGPAAAFLGGARSSNEDLFVLRRLFQEVLGSQNMDHRLGPAYPSAADVRAALGSQSPTPIAAYERMTTIIVFGCDLAVELPILYLRVRKAAVRRGAKVIECQPSSYRERPHANKVTDFAHSSIWYEPGQETPIAEALAHVMTGGRDPGASEGASDAAASLPNAGAEANVEFGSAIPRLDDGPIAIIIGRDVWSRSLSVPATLKAAADKMGTPCVINTYACSVNEQGARELGILPDGSVQASAPGLNADQILHGLKDGTVKALWVSGVDIASQFHDPELVTQSLEQAPFVVVTALDLNRTATMADVVLPLASVAEYDGTYTSMERRVQRFHQAFDAGVDVREEWRIAANVGMRLGVDMPYASWRDIFGAIATSERAFAECTPDNLGDGGRLLADRNNEDSR